MKGNSMSHAIVSLGYSTSFMVPLSDLSKLMEMLVSYPPVEYTWVNHKRVFYKTNDRLPSVEIVNEVLDEKPEEPKAENEAA